MMKYVMLLWPHANSRYQEATQPLGLSELCLLLGAENLCSQPECVPVAGAPALRFESALEPGAVVNRIKDHAHMYLLLLEGADGGAQVPLIPLCSRREAFLGGDLPGVLKYKGKTNEVFTRFLINLALFSSAFRDRADERLRLLDPMCGRGTALFEALNRGFDAFGSDIDRADIREADAFFKRYLTYHKIKHKAKELSMTLPGGGKKSLRRKQYLFMPDADAYKAGDERELSLMCADALDATRAFPPKHFHLIAIDLPYGVQHAAGGAKPENLEKLLLRVLPQLRERLMPGGAIAMSFNANTLPLAQARALLSEAGFDALSGAPYDGLSHWVEQAVTRDAAVGLRKP